MTDTSPKRDVPPAFADVAEARFRSRQAFPDPSGESAAREEYAALRTLFEIADGDIQREYWGTHLPIGLVLTERRRSIAKRWLRRAPTMHLHRSTSHLENMPVAFHASLHRGDMLAVRAGWSLGDHSRHTVLDRVFDAQVFLLTIADNALGRVDDRDTAIRSSSTSERLDPGELEEALVHHYDELYRIQNELNRAANRRAQYLYVGGALLGVLGCSVIAAVCAAIAWRLGHSVYSPPVAFAFGCAAAGTLGATASVSWRASVGHLRVDPAAGIAALPRLGALRPSIGAIFGLALYFALRSGVLNIGQSASNFYFFAFFGFVAGFSERALPDIVRRAEGQLATAPSSDPLRGPESSTTGDCRAD